MGIKRLKGQGGIIPTKKHSSAVYDVFMCFIEQSAIIVFCIGVMVTALGSPANARIVTNFDRGEHARWLSGTPMRGANTTVAFIALDCVPARIAQAQDEWMASGSYTSFGNQVAARAGRNGFFAYARGGDGSAGQRAGVGYENQFNNVALRVYAEGGNTDEPNTRDAGRFARGVVALDAVHGAARYEARITYGRVSLDNGIRQPYLVQSDVQHSQQFLYMRARSDITISANNNVGIIGRMANCNSQASWNENGMTEWAGYWNIHAKPASGVDAGVVLIGSMQSWSVMEDDFDNAKVQLVPFIRGARGGTMLAVVGLGGVEMIGGRLDGCRLADGAATVGMECSYNLKADRADMMLEGEVPLSGNLALTMQVMARHSPADDAGSLTLGCRFGPAGGAGGIAGEARPYADNPTRSATAFAPPAGAITNAAAATAYATSAERLGGLASTLTYDEAYFPAPAEYWNGGMRRAQCYGYSRATSAICDKAVQFVPGGDRHSLTYYDDGNQSGFVDYDRLFPTNGFDVGLYTTPYTNYSVLKGKLSGEPEGYGYYYGDCLDSLVDMP